MLYELLSDPEAVDRFPLDIELARDDLSGTESLE